ncbi:MAG: hypothetical protein JWP02_238 [Acidimicrobiales bacterium]|nr:hypothetical protein [Acidimicrobiales bacterium]
MGGVIALRVLAFVAGGLLVAWTLLSAVRAVVLPRGVSVTLSRWVFVPISELFRLRLRFAKTWEERDRIMALYGPIGLLSLPFAWLVLVLVGYTGMFWAFGGHGLRRVFELSGSSLFTFGFVTPGPLPQTVLAFSEAIFGLGLLALLISFLPSIYAAFSRREQLVALLEVRAGNPPSVFELLRRFYIIHGLERLSPMFARWEEWFADVEETHTSQAAIVYFRSPLPNRSWLTSAGAVLDSAAFASSSLDRPRDAQAELCVRSGYLCLRRIAAFFGVSYDPDPAPDDPISIDRHEYDEVYDQLAAVGVPLKPDRDQAWRDFAGWRVNYDTVLVALARVIMAPPAPWSSDRTSKLRPDVMSRRFRPWPGDE